MFPLARFLYFRCSVPLIFQAPREELEPGLGPPKSLLCPPVVNPALSVRIATCTDWPGLLIGATCLLADEAYSHGPPLSWLTTPWPANGNGPGASETLVASLADG